MKKPFFFRIDAGDLINFATDPEGENISLLRFAKELQKGESDIPYIQGLINESKEFIAKKANAGKKGMKSRWLNKTSADNTVITQLNTVITNDNTPVTSSSNTNNLVAKTFSSEAYRLSGVLSEKILANNPRHTPIKESDRNRWAEDIDKLHRIDKQNWDDIEKVLLWCQSDNFWKAQILSGKKFREKWDSLSAKMQSTKTINTPAPKVWSLPENGIYY